LVVKGTLVDASCLKKEGAATVLSAEHIGCANECFEKGQPLGVFSEDLGLVKIVGEFPAKNHAMLLSLLGKVVEVRGSRGRGGDYSTLIDARSIQAAAK